jgi:hypothetical protein
MLGLIDAQIIIVFVYKLWKSIGVAFLVMNIILMVFTSIFTLFVLSLVFTHIFLVSSNMTTYEMCKKHWKIKSGNPFKKSNFIKNFIKMCYTGTGNPKKSDPFAPVVPK